MKTPSRDPGRRFPRPRGEEAFPAGWHGVLPLLLCLLMVVLPLAASATKTKHHRHSKHHKHVFPFVISRTVYYARPGTFQYSLSDPRYRRIFSRHTMVRINGVFYFAEYGDAPRRHYSIGWERLNRGQFYRASKAFEEVLEGTSDSYATGLPRVGLLLARTLEYRNTQSLPHLVHVLENNPEALRYTPFSRSIDRDVLRVREQLGEELEYDPEMASHWLMLTALNIVQHRFRAARRSFESLRSTREHRSVYPALQNLTEPSRSSRGGTG